MKIATATSLARGHVCYQTGGVIRSSNVRCPPFHSRIFSIDVKDVGPIPTS